MIIPVANPQQDEYERSYLANPISAGVTTLEVKNNDRFAANDRIQIGEMGQDKTEVVTVTSVNANGTSIVHGTTVFAHSADDPVVRLQFDQVKFYRSTTGSTGSYSVLSTQNLDVDNEDMETIYDDTTGLSTYYYKISFYNSVSAVESSLSGPIPGGGFARNQVGHIIDEVLQEVSDQAEQHMSRGELLGYFNDVNDDLQMNASKPYSFLKARTTLTRTAATNYLAYPTDSAGNQTMWKFDHMDYNFTDSTTDPVTDITDTIKVIPLVEFRNLYSDNTISSTTESDAKPVAMALDDAVSRFRFSQPFLTTTSNVFYLYYWAYFNTLDSEDDTIQTPTPKIYKLYAKMMYYSKRAIADVTLSSKVQEFAAQYNAEKARYKQVDRKDKGTPRGFRPMSTTQQDYRR